MKKLLGIICMCVFTFTLIGIFSLPVSAQTTKWVDQAVGSDANNGNTEATAYATLQFAIDNSSSGTDDTRRSVINVKDGIYGSAGTVNNLCGNSLAAIVIQGLDYLTIQAVPGHEPVVAPVTAVEVDVVSIAVESSDHLIIDNIDSDQTVAQFDNWHFCSDNLIVRNSSFKGGKDGIDFSGILWVGAVIENNDFIDINTGNGDEVLDFTDAFVYQNVVIQDNNFENNHRQITIEPVVLATGFTIRRNMMNGTTSQEAVRLNGASQIVLENNVIMNSMQQGVYIDTYCSDITIQQNSFFNNDQEGLGEGPPVDANGEIRTEVTSDDIVIKNNIFYANGVNSIFETDVSQLPSEDYNLVYNSPQIDPSFTFGPNTITGDPLFVDTAAGSEDLHLQPGSPAIEAGTDLRVPDDKDKDSRPRPSGTDPDMGAYEFSEDETGLDHFLGYKVKTFKVCDGGVTVLTLLNNGPAGEITVETKDGVVFGPEDVSNRVAFGFGEEGVKVGKSITVTVRDDSGAKISEIQIHTSCSIPIYPGLKFGDFEVVEGESLKGGPLEMPAPNFERLEVTLTDRFEKGIFKVEKPDKLYNPADKEGEGINNEDTHLMSYKIKLVQILPPEPSCAPCKGGLTSLTLRNEGGADANIVVTAEKDDEVLFDEYVANGNAFTVDGTGKDGKLDKQITIWVDGIEGPSIHTSCSQPIGTDQPIGGFTVIAGESKDGGALCPIIRVEDQFGILFLGRDRAERLLVPSLKDLEDAILDEDLPDEFPLDHFKCYKVKAPKDYPEIQVTVVDQFNQPKLYNVEKAKMYCTPVEKNINNAITPITNEEAYLTCYKIKPVDGEPEHEKLFRIHVNNQFGPLMLNTEEKYELCVPPTSKTAVSPAL